MIKPFRSFLCHGFLLGLLGLLFTSGGFAQSHSAFDFTPEKDESANKLYSKLPSLGSQAGDMFFEGPVNPDDYHVGPGDKLSIVLWQPSYADYPCSISAEGNVTIPMVGSVSLVGLTLTEAKARIEQTVSQILRSGKVSISLIQPRQFRVHVSGLVKNPGSYTVYATARVLDAIDLAGGLKTGNWIPGIDSCPPILASLRRIELRDRDDKPVGKADLQLFQCGGKIGSNPVLEDGQTIFVPYPDRSDTQVGIYGGVNNSGVYEYSEGDRLEDIFTIAGGLTSRADSSAVIIVNRLGGNKIALDLRGNHGQSVLTQEIHAGDRIYIPESPDTSHVGSVLVKGEVARPGGYPITVGQTTLRQLLELTGGFLPDAVLNSARLIRRATSDLIEPEKHRILQAGLTPATTPIYSTDPGLSAELGRWNYATVVVDLNQVLSKDSKDGDLKLEDGDVLEIPSAPLGVRVFGFVNHAGDVSWKPNMKIDYYVSSAGGINTAGWLSRAVIIKARNGSQLRYQTSLPIDPGDVIYVPSKPETTNWTLFKDVVGVVAQVATLVLIGQNLGK